MEWIVKELVILTGPLYLFLQVIMLMRYRGRWRLLAAVPLVLMGPLAVHAGFAYAAGHPLWPSLVVLGAPIVCGYLLLLAVLKAAAA